MMVLRIAKIGILLLAIGACGSPGSSQDANNGSASDATSSFIDTTTVGVDASDSDATENTNCGQLMATIRDFHVSHPDFETFGGNNATTGIIENTLGADGKPVYVGGRGQTTGAGEFNQWYNDVPGINSSVEIALTLTEVTPGFWSYSNNSFFPVDNEAFGNEGYDHNFHFTTEIHTTFKYQGGESFTFKGDDDLWLFINGRLAIDLGGLHEELSQTINLDAIAASLGITAGETYPMDIFHAERHTVDSNFHIETTIDCFIID